MTRSSRTDKTIESQSWNKGGPWPGGKYFLVRPSHSVHKCIILRLILQLQSRNSNLLISLSTLTVQRKWLNVTLHGRRVTVSCPAVLRGSYWTDCNDYQYSGTLKNIHRYFSFSIYFDIYIDISHFQALSCTLVQSRSRVLIPLTSACSLRKGLKRLSERYCALHCTAVKRHARTHGIICRALTGAWKSTSWKLKLKA